MAQIHDHPDRKGDSRREVPEGLFEPRAKGRQGFVWYVKAEIQGSRWRERAARLGDDGERDQDCDGSN